MFEKAIEDYTKAIEINPKHAEAYFIRGNIFKKRDMYDKAIEDYTKAILSNPNYAEAYGARGRIYNERELFDTAIEDFTKAIQLNPGDSGHIIIAEALASIKVQMILVSLTGKRVRFGERSCKKKNKDNF